MNSTKNLFGLLGKGITYSFSEKYFTNKFIKENLPYQYKNIDVDDIGGLFDFLANNIEYLQGFNITIPYKEEILPYLDEIDTVAEEIGAVNCVKILEDNRLKGFNTDAFGFEKSFRPLLKPMHKKALIFGTGGASKAIAFTLDKLHIPFVFVSRNMQESIFSYQDITKEILEEYTILINTTPLGTKGKMENQSLEIPYEYITKNHLLYDLVYNPLETLFLKKCKKGITKNGLEMLELQADKSWEIWTENK